VAAGEAAAATATASLVQNSSSERGGWPAVATYSVSFSVGETIVIKVNCGAVRILMVVFLCRRWPLTTVTIFYESVLLLPLSGMVPCLLLASVRWTVCDDSSHQAEEREARTNYVLSPVLKLAKND